MKTEEITTDFVKMVANNSALSITENEAESFKNDFKDILSYFETISAVDTSSLPASFHPIPVRNNYRDDTVKQSLSKEDALRNVKETTTEGLIRGPKVVSK